MTAALVELQICINGDCAARYAEGEGWNGACDACCAVADEHDAGFHVQPADGCGSCT